jgi:dihydrodipicolinate synthase/N-acetylneuraminate lyase
MTMPIDPLSLIRPRRKILGMSAVLLPFLASGEVDWVSFRNLLSRTAASGLVPAVNMDTGYANLIDDATRRQVLTVTHETLGNSQFVAGAFVGDKPGSPFHLDAYSRQMDWIIQAEATPVIFQSYGLTGQGDEEILAAYRAIGQHCDRFIGFELGTMFAPFGRIYSIELYRELMGIPQCIGAKHSSLSRPLEWERLVLRDRVRSDFHVFTGNDLAIDMVMYGSDYLLGLSAFAPDLFAQRDLWWESGDSRFYELNDKLQYLGCLAFRDPVPAYKHSAAMFLKLRGWIESDLTHPQSPNRPESDREILWGIFAATCQNK